MKNNMKNGSNEPVDNVTEDVDDVVAGPDTAELLAASKSRAPLTKAQWEEQQNKLCRVLDPDTGRMRLIRGTGEVVEECVSRRRAVAINKQATRGDGDAFQQGVAAKLASGPQERQDNQQ
ncbi:ADP-ribosylation factor-like protein 6-interacting protein 4 isoform X2 [Hyalella azteca]|uniref:ADP-ribosylation factor-like protein 6-interacting protein 4 n=1 Tax=Hyalella azteca TaxID=294128 RepID=A0A8B7P7R5_HYAAZ|nr:ADP-ribosylation factor-like protein 6-interacting protein 4 isoform X1 [Hyalella azteca]XP_018021878.1 ADP-ribosylation factor-like protein 6-interacting protein 4 isoform X2 [Hyalella azteca]